MGRVGVWVSETSCKSIAHSCVLWSCSLMFPEPGSHMCECGSQFHLTGIGRVKVDTWVKSRWYFGNIRFLSTRKGPVRKTT